MATEAFRKQVSRQLTELQDGTGPPSISFPATLSSEERKYIHHLCHQFGLKSKSKGNGANRYLTVERKANASKGKGSGGPGAANGKGQNATDAQLKSISQGSPLRLSQHLFQDARLTTLPDCPQQWTITGPADLRRLQNRGAGGKGGHRDHVMAEVPSRESLDASESARLSKRPAYASMQAGRQKLPAWGKADEILEALQLGQVVLVAGETGCGKSTQVPQFLLDAMPSAKLIVTQPRRIAAVSLAQRVADERCETVGSSIGYSIHMESRTSKDTRCTFCTTGVFRRRLLGDHQLSGVTHVVVDEVHERELHGDFVLVILKQLLEERPDLQLVLMSATLQLHVFQRFFPGCATVQIPGRTFPVHQHYLDDVVTMLYSTPRFRPFFGPAFAAAGHVADEKDFKRQVAQNEGHFDQVCGYGRHLNEPMTKLRLADGLIKHDVLQQGKGTTFDIPIIDALILYLDQEHQKLQKTNPALQPGAILIFFPGWGDIDQAKKRLRSSLDERRFLILPCHSQVRADQQRKIFNRPPPGVRKIILASNIAETSITIEDVSIVIDTGRAKETSYDPYLKVGTLATVFISKASASQRAGRAGRTKEGRCYHLYSRKRYDLMEAFRAPELLRSPLEDVCLHTAHLLAQRRAAGISKDSGPAGIAAWLASAPQPPEAVAVKNAVGLLKILGALTPKGEISQLGVQLANLPLPTTVARSVVWGALLGCLDEVLIVLGASTGRDPFQLPQDPSGRDNRLGGRGSSFGQLSGLLKRLKKELAFPVESDHIALLRAAQCYEEARHRGDGAVRAVCDRHSLNRNAAQSVVEVRDKMKRELKQQRLLSDDMDSFVNRNAGDVSVILAVVVAGVFPNLAAKRPQKKKIEVNGGRVDANTHPASILDKGGGGGGKDGKSGKGGGPAEWLCYTEMTQVEERYSMTGVSWVSPVALLLLCGDEPLEIQGEGADVSVSLLDGWAEFVMPRSQVTSLQNLRFALRQAFADYCQAPWKYEDHTDALDYTVSLLQESMDETGRPARADPSYKPKADAYVAPAQHGTVSEEYAALEQAVSGVVAENVDDDDENLVDENFPMDHFAMEEEPESYQVEVPELREGLEIQGVTELLRELYGPPANGQAPIDWHFVAGAGGQFQATLVVPQDRSTYDGEMMPGKKSAQRSAARAAWEALQAWRAEQAGVVRSTYAGEEQEEAELSHTGQELEVGGEDANEEALDPEADAACEEKQIAEDEDDLLDDLADPSMAAAMRFMAGDIDYKDAGLGLPEDQDEPGSASKRRRLG